MIFDESAAASLELLMQWRRDVRHFRPEPVPDAMMERLANAMAMAPSVGNSRPWRVMRVRDPSRRAAVIACFERCNADATQSYVGAKREQYLKLKLAGLREAPEHLAVFTQINPREGDGLGRATMPETLDYSTMMAIHSLWLVARVLNLGVGWVSILDVAEIRTILDPDPAWRFAAYLCVGYPVFHAPQPLLQECGWQHNVEHAWLER
jgi:5,6-dimethylbenzimidazole synthase